MDTRDITPVSGRTRSQMNLSNRKEFSQSSRMGPKLFSRTPEAPGGPPNSIPKLSSNAVREVEFLLVDRDGTVRKKFYFDEMVISLDSEHHKGKETIEEGTTTMKPIILSDDDDDDDDDDDEEQGEPKEDSSSANKKQGSKESMPVLEKRQKFDEQQLPGLPMINSSLKGVDAQSFPGMKVDKLFKDMKGGRDRLFKDMKGDKLFKDLKFHTP